MNSNRRSFLQRAGLVTLGLGIRAVAQVSAPPRETNLPTPRAKALMAAFGLDCPIFQAGMGSVAAPDLAIAVSRAGGLGAIALSGASPERARELVAQVKAGTDRPFAVAYLLRSEQKSLGAALDAGAPVVQFAFGLPSREQVAQIRSARAKFGIQISNPDGALRGIDLGADYLICQGTEAGGHVQASEPWHDTLPRVLEVAKTTPLLAAGGIADGASIRRVLLAGAAGVLIGTRFVATNEANAHLVYKTALTQAKAADTVLTVCFQGGGVRPGGGADGWVNAPHRVLRNRTLTMWEAAGCPPAGQRPGEGDIVGTTADGAKRLRYAGNPPGPTLSGEIEEMAMYAGKGVDAIRQIMGAGDLVKLMWRDCLNA